MHPVANHLIQLQELIMIRDEQSKVAVARQGEAHLEQLDQSIRTMTEELPLDIRTHFQKLLKKERVTIVPVDNGVCAGCGMSLAISYVQAVRMAKEVLMCPNCARMLYVSDLLPRRIAKREPRFGGPRKVGIMRFSAPQLMQPQLAATDTEGVIREMAYLMEAGGYVEKAEALIEPALRREAILSTATNHGIAFPHVRGVEGGGLTLACGLSNKGIASFDSTNPAQTHIVFFLMIPAAASAFYLKLLSGLAETFSKTEARKALLAESDPEKMWRTLVKLTRSTVK